MKHLNLQKSVKDSERFLERTGDDPYFDWALILCVSSVVALVFIICSVNLFLDIDTAAAASVNGSDVSGESSTASGASASSLNTNNLVNLVSIFESKKSQLSVYVAMYPGPDDPAIPLRAVAPAKIVIATSTKKTTTSTKAK